MEEFSNENLIRALVQGIIWISIPTQECFEIICWNFALLYSNLCAGYPSIGGGAPSPGGRRRRRAEPIFRGSGGGRGGGGLGLGAAAFGGCQENAPFAHYGIVFSHHSPAHPVY